MVALEREIFERQKIDMQTEKNMVQSMTAVLNSQLIKQVFKVLCFVLVCYSVIYDRRVE